MANCVTVASPGLPYKEHFTDTVWMDPDRTSAEWRVCEHALMQGFQKTRWQSTRLPWDRRVLDETGYDTRSIAVGDLNDDGHLDIVVANYGEVNLLYFGGGDGTFGAGIPLSPHSHNTQDIGLGDLNGDAYPDIIEGNSNQSNCFYTNKGDGSFQEPVIFPGDSRDTHAVTMEDVNKDGWMDVIFAHNEAPPRCFYNEGGGVFKEGVALGKENLHATSLLAKDMTGDGWPDLILGNWAYPARLFLNDGNGFFLESFDIQDDARKTWELAVGDINNDGQPEVIAGNFASVNRVYSIGPDFQWTASDFTGNTASTVGMALGDLDGNGWIDAVTAEDSLAHRVYLNSGHGVFSSGMTLFDGVQAPTCVALADLDGNGLPDIIAGNARMPNCVYLIRGCAHPFIGVQAAVLEDTSLKTTCLASGDMNGDTLSDNIAGKMNGKIYLYLNQGQGVFSKGTPLITEEQATTSIAAGDINKDGFLDVIVGNMKQRNRGYINNGDGTLAGFDISSDICATTSVKIGDINGDGFPDVVVGNMGRENQLFLNDRSGAFLAGMDITDDIFDTFCVALGDVNGDGRLDVVTGNYGSKNRLYLNTGKPFPFFGVTGQSVSDDTGNTLSLELTDMNGDGRLDVVAGNYDGTNRLYLNKGTETPFDGVDGMDITNDKDKTFSVASGDLDGDGDLDLVAGNVGAPDRLYLNNGTDIPFGEVMGISVSDHSYETLCVLVCDVDNDRVLDIISGHKDAPGGVYRNPGRPQRRYGLLCSEEEAPPFPEMGALDTSNTDVIHASVGAYRGEGKTGCGAPHFSLNDRTAYSLAVNSPQETVSAVTLSMKTDLPPNTDIAFYLTNTGGEQWMGAYDGQTLFFPTPGNRLAWKAVFHSLSSVYSARIYEIGLTVPDFTVVCETDGTPGALLQGEVTQKIPAGGSALPVTAVPPDGYRFARWMLEGSHFCFENPFLAKDVRKNRKLTAMFAREIRTPEALMRIGNDPEFPLDGRYSLGGDLELSGDNVLPPIGKPEAPFTGWFFGNNHRISGLGWSSARDTFNGLFSVIGEGGEVHDLFLRNVSITHNGPVTGALAGCNNGLIDNCHVTGRIVYDYYTNVRGGLVGENGASGTILHSSAIAEISAQGESIGGLAGRNLGAIRESFFRGSVLGEKVVGGIAGCQEKGSLYHSHALGRVTALSENAGGLAGMSTSAEMVECFASGEVVSGAGPAGGLIGSAWTTQVRRCFALSRVKADKGHAAALTGMHSGGNVESCYAAGSVAGSLTAGLLNCPKEAVPDVTNSFWDRESTGQDSAGPPGIELDGATGKTTAEMMRSHTYANWGFDTEDAFSILENKTYPFFRWNPPEAAIECIQEDAADTALFDVRFSMPIPGFDGNDLNVAGVGLARQEVSVAPANPCYPSTWRVAVKVDGVAGRVYAAVVMPDALVSDMAAYTVFPGIPSCLVVENAAVDSITWKWKDNSSIEDGFLLYLGKGQLSLDAGAEHVPPDTERYTAQGLAPNTKFVFQVSATLGEYESMRTEAVTAWTLAYPPLKPTLANPKANSIDVSVTPGDGNPPSTEYALRISPALGVNCWVQPGGGLGDTPAWNTADAWSVTGIRGLNSATQYTIFGTARNGGAVLSEEGPGENIFTECELLYTPGSNGTVTNVPRTVAYGQDGPVVTAEPEPGHRFLCWSDGNAENPRRDKSITANIRVEAQFGPLFAGMGTAEVPYEITDVNLLQEMRTFPDRHFVLKNDLDASETATWNEGAGFQPVGSKAVPFTGTLDGGKFVVSGLTIHAPKGKNTGLFGVVGSGGHVKRMVLNEVRINAEENVGGLAGLNNGGKLSECLVTGEVTGTMNVGGLVGFSETGAMELCRANGAITGTENVGGLAGFNKNTAFSRSYAFCTVNGKRNVGGFAGYNFKCIVTNCYSRSSVTGEWYVGGLLAYNHTGSVQYCYAVGNVSGPAFPGGLLGFNDNGSVVASYWDAATTKQAASHGSEPSFGKTTQEMRVASTFQNWDFTAVWAIRETLDYPWLQAVPEHP